MSKIRISTVTSAIPNRIRIGEVTAGTAVANAKIRIGAVTAGIPTGPQPGVYVWNGAQWLPGTVWVYTGEDIVEAPAPSGWRKAAIV